MSYFHFKNFSILQSDAAMKVGTDSMLLGSFINSTDKKCALDVGAGSGVLSLMVAQENREIKIDAVEIDKLSMKECVLNFEASDWSARLEVFHTDFLEFKIDKKYDLIFSNPPYYRSTLVSNDDIKATAKHERSLPIPVFLKKVSASLTLDGVVWIIIPFMDKYSWEKNAEQSGLFVSKETRVSGKKNKEPNRIILELRKRKNKLVSDHFIIRNDNGTYSDAYIELTKEFHRKEL